jgi:TfoX/Sxy family transcriptional regulator of competence genes
MAYNERLTNRVRAALAHVTNVEEKKMFGGIAFMVDGKMCITVGDNEIMCRIDPALNDMVLTKKGCRPVIMKGHEYKGYVYVNEDAVKTKKDFDYWIGLSLDFNKTAKSSKKNKKK